MIKPQRGTFAHWHVWDEDGAVEALERKEYIFLNPFTIAFANGSHATISATHPLWRLLDTISQERKVEIMVLSGTNGQYINWPKVYEMKTNFGDSDHVTFAIVFDTIRISE